MNNLFNANNYREIKPILKDNKKTIDNSHYSRLSSADKSKQALYQSLKKYTPSFDKGSKKNEINSNRISKEKKNMHIKKNSEIPSNRQIALPLSRIKKSLKKDIKSFTSFNMCNSHTELSQTSNTPIQCQTLNTPTNHHQIMKENMQLQRIIKILIFYIQKLNQEIQNCSLENYKRLAEQIVKLKEENKYIIKENQNLKLKILTVMELAKNFDLSEVKREEQTKRFMSQLLLENIYLRKANVKTAGIVANDLFKRNAIPNSNKENTNKENNYNKVPEENKNNLEDPKIQEEIPTDKIIDNPFNAFNNGAKGTHRRQRTHFNLSNTQNNDTIQSNSSESSESSSRESGIQDYFGETFHQMKASNMTMRRNQGSKKNVVENESNNENKNDDNQQSPSNKENKFPSPNSKQQIFYRTPKSNEKNNINKIEFTH